MNIKKPLTLGLIAIALPLSSFALAPSAPTTAGLQLSPNAILERISQQIGTATTQMNTNDGTLYKQQSTVWEQQQQNWKTQLNNWDQYFKQNQPNAALQQAPGFEKLAQQVNPAATRTSLVSGLNLGFVLGANLKGFPCGSDNPAGSSYCPSANISDANYANYDAQNIMDYDNTEGNDFQTSDSYISDVVQAGNNDYTDGSAQLGQLPAVSAIQNSLQQIKRSYTLPDPINDNFKTKSGQKVTKTIQPPSQMQAIHAAVKAPYSPTFQSALGTASNTQVNRSAVQLIAAGNAMKYKSIKSQQSLNVLVANLLSQQVQTNALLRENLAATRALLKAQQNNK